MALPIADSSRAAEPCVIQDRVDLYGLRRGNGPSSNRKNQPLIQPRISNYKLARERIKVRYSNIGVTRSVSSFLVVMASCFGAYAISTSPLSHSRTQTTPSPPLTFDIASIKASAPDANAFLIRPNPNNFVAQGATLKFLIQYAFDLHDFQIEGDKEWMNRKRFDVLGKMDPPGNDVSGKDGSIQKNLDWTLARARLRTLLIERFNLRFHQSTKEEPIYALMVAKGGPKLQPSVANTGYSSGSGEFRCSSASMEDLASMLSDVMGRVIRDSTHLSGSYQFTLKFSPEDDPSINSSSPVIFTALQEQLGLKLIPAKGPVDVMVIDNAEMPTSN